MKASLVLSVVALGLSVVALGGMLAGGRGPDGRGAPGGGEVVLGGSAVWAELEAKLAALEGRLARLEVRPAESVAARVVAEGGVVSREEFEALRAELEEALAVKEGLHATPLADPEAFEEQVADSLARIRKEEAVKSVREKQDQRADRLDQDVAKVEDWLGLSAPQSDSLRTALLTQYEREAEIRRLWEEGTPDEVLGEQKQADREAFYADLGGFLDPDQLETFWGTVAGGK